MQEEFKPIPDSVPDSQGMKQRLASAQALMEKSSLLVLDEQLNVIDSKSVAYFRKLFLELNEKEGVMILLTSHYSEDIRELCKNTDDILFANMLSGFYLGKRCLRRQEGHNDEMFQ